MLVQAPSRIEVCEQFTDGKEAKVLFEKLQHLVDKHFPEYEFVNHEILFNSDFKGSVPHGEDEHYSRDSYSIFSFLFGLSAGFENLDILE